MAPRKPPKPPTRERLEKSALHYLERFAASAEGLRRVLMRKVERAAREGLADRAQGALDVAFVVENSRPSISSTMRASPKGGRRVSRGGGCRAGASPSA